MARRALRKLDPTLDLSWHYVELESLTAPFEPTAVFGCEAPLEVEIGSGKGLFLSAAATENPDHNFLGIERATKYARYAASRLAQRNLSNARLVHGDAKRLLTEWIPDNSLAAVHVYFPDPWWKARHKKRRMMTEGIVREIERVLCSHHASRDEAPLAPGDPTLAIVMRSSTATPGTLHFWTDVEEYFQATLELIAAHTKLTGPHQVQEQPADHDLDYRTHFERRMRQNNLPVYRAEFRKE